MGLVPKQPVKNQPTYKRAGKFVHIEIKPPDVRTSDNPDETMITGNGRGDVGEFKSGDWIPNRISCMGNPRVDDHAWYYGEYYVICCDCGINRESLKKDHGRSSDNPDNFKVGDLVKLKSGGLTMTVDELLYDGHDIMVKWFDNSMLRSYTFRSTSLIHVRPSDNPDNATSTTSPSSTEPSE